MSIFGAFRCRRLFREFPIVADGVNQIGDGVLTIFEGFANGVFDQSAFKVDRFSGRWRKLDARVVFEYPPDFLKDVPGAFTRCSGRFQLVEQILNCFRSNRHRKYVQTNTFTRQRGYLGIFVRTNQETFFFRAQVI